MTARRLTGVQPTRPEKFFRFEIGRDGIFLAHWDVGSFCFGRDWCRREGWVLSGGLMRRADARESEIPWRWYFRLPLTLPRLVWVQDAPFDWGIYPAALWTGREFRLYAIRWFRREWRFS